MRFYTTVSEGPVTLGQPFQVQYVIEDAASIEQFALPKFPAFKVLDSFDNKNPVLSSQGTSLVQAYSRIIVLVATREGNFTLPPASAIINGKKQWSKLATIQVGKPEVKTASATESVALEQNSVLQPGENIEEKIRKHVFLKAIANTQQCYAGQGITVSYKLYSALNTSARVERRPALSGFSVLEMVDAYDSKPEEEWLNGKAYYVNLVRKVHLFPLQSGPITLESAQVECTVHFSKGQETNDIRSLLNKAGGSARSNSGEVIDQVSTIRSVPLIINVKPLPPQSSDLFTGAVGQFTMRMEADTDKVKAGDLVKLRVVIEGTGNFPLIVAPQVQWPIGVDTAEPEVGEDFDRFVFPLKGKKSFGYSFTAPQSGEVIIPATKMLYFDPSVSQYKICSTEPLKIVISNRTAEDKAVAAPENNNTTSIPRERYWFGLVVLGIVGWVSYQFWMSRKDKKQVTETKMEVPVIPERRILELPVSLHHFVEKGEADGFYRELQRVLWESIGMTTHLPPSRWNKLEMETALRALQCNETTIIKLQGLLRQCELALYGLDPGAETLNHDHQTAKEVMQDLNELPK